MNTIKVLYIVSSLETGGTERQVFEASMRHDRKRFEPIVACLVKGGPLQGRLNEAGVRVDVFNFKIENLIKNIPWNLLQFFKLVRYIKQIEPDIVYAFIYSPVIFGLPAAKLAGVHIVISGWRNIYYAWMDHSYLCWLDRLAHRYAHYAIANSKGVMEEVLRREKLPPDRVRLIYNGCDYGRFDNCRQTRIEVRKELGIGENDFVIGVLANLYFTKGQEYLLRALPCLLNVRRDLKVMLIGRDRGRETYLREICRGLGIEDKVIFTGERSDIPALLGAMDIGVNTSSCEGFSNAILEMMAAGLPMVVTDVGGNAEAVVHGETGFVVPPENSDALAESIVELLQNPQQVSNMGEAAGERIRGSFSIEGMMKKLEELYDEFLENGFTAGYNRLSDNS